MAQKVFPTMVSIEKYLESAKLADEAACRFADMKQYNMDAVDRVDEAAEEIRNLLETC